MDDEQQKCEEEEQELTIESHEVNTERCSDWAAVLVAELFMCDWEKGERREAQNVRNPRHAKGLQITSLLALSPPIRGQQTNFL